MMGNAAIVDLVASDVSAARGVFEKSGHMNPATNKAFYLWLFVRVLCALLVRRMLGCV